MELTPLERIEQQHLNFALFRATVSATQDLMKVARECDNEIEAFRANIRAGIRSSEDQKSKTANALRDARMTNEAIAALAETLEIKFGINA